MLFIELYSVHVMYLFIFILNYVTLFFHVDFKLHCRLLISASKYPPNISSQAADRNELSQIIFT